jgi:hypothetical protein
MGGGREPGSPGDVWAAHAADPPSPSASLTLPTARSAGFVTNV